MRKEREEIAAWTILGSISSNTEWAGGVLILTNFKNFLFLLFFILRICFFY